jgi:hypothetical protein
MRICWSRFKLIRKHALVTAATLVLSFSVSNMLFNIDCKHYYTLNLQYQKCAAYLMCDFNHLVVVSLWF